MGHSNQRNVATSTRQEERFLRERELRLQKRKQKRREAEELFKKHEQSESEPQR